MAASLTSRPVPAPVRERRQAREDSNDVRRFYERNTMRPKEPEPTIRRLTPTPPKRG